jgi:hypothetical protein
MLGMKNNRSFVLKVRQVPWLDNRAADRALRKIEQGFRELRAAMDWRKSRKRSTRRASTKHVKR